MRVDKIVLTRAAQLAISREASRRAPLESGGMLIGRIVAGAALIQLATGPGPGAQHTASGFRRDGAYSQVMLDQAVQRSRGRWDYLGEWHSHPADVGASGRDGASMREIANDAAYQRRQPLLVVLVRANRRWRVRAYQWRDDALVELPLTVRRAVTRRGATTPEASRTPRVNTTGARSRRRRRR